MSDRAMQRADFVAASGWGDARESLLAGDASFRKYFRLRRGAASAVVMDAPPPQEDVRPFVQIARHLLALGFSPPEVLAEDPERGFLLLEDLGDDTYARVLESGGDEQALYTRAVDVLVALHATGNRAVLGDLRPYIGEVMISAAMLLPEWYLPAAAGRPTPGELMDSYRAAWRACFSNLPSAAETLVLRDYHKDNLIWLPGRGGVRACGLLDFQDAQTGHPAYDLVSLIDDARRDVTPAVQKAAFDRYLAEAGVADRAAFTTAFHIVGAQRHARIIGVFVRLSRRDGRPHYVTWLPRVWRQFETALAHEALQPLRAWIDRHVPPPLRSLPTT
jgi:aminoglycoside/choline kinase family phosphotransferase